MSSGLKLPTDEQLNYISNNSDPTIEPGHITFLARVGYVFIPAGILYHFVHEPVAGLLFSILGASLVILKYVARTARSSGANYALLEIAVAQLNEIAD